MIDDEKLLELIVHEELILEGLPKGFWRLVKLSPFEIWEMPERAEYEYACVVAVIGSRCIFFDEVNKGFVMVSYKTHGEISDSSLNMNALSLTDLMNDIIDSRFVI